MNTPQKYLIVIAGPTAVGKTALTIQLAQTLRTEILNADARQFFKETEIGTAKPTLGELTAAKHHFIDSLSIQQSYNAASFEKDALNLMDQLFKQYDELLLSGGSGMYIKAVCEGFSEMPETIEGVRQQLVAEMSKNGLPTLLDELEEKDPIYFEKVDKANPQRIVRALEVIRSTGQAFSSFRNHHPKKRKFSTVKIGLELPRHYLYERIDARMDEMIKAGLFEEAERLLPYQHLNALNTVGYKEVFGYLEGNYDREEAVRLLKRNSRRYAKRQLTWFKADPAFTWFAPTQTDQIIDHIIKVKKDRH